MVNYSKKIYSSHKYLIRRCRKLWSKCVRVGIQYPVSSKLYEAKNFFHSFFILHQENMHVEIFSFFATFAKKMGDRFKKELENLKFYLVGMLQMCVVCMYR